MELMEYLEGGSLWNIGDNSRQIVLDGSLNCQEFEGDNETWRPQSHLWSDAYRPNPIAQPNVYRLRKGRFGYIINLRTGLVKVCPIRGRWDVWYSIDPLDNTELTVNQVHSNRLELYVDRPKIRRSFYLGERGFKLVYRLKPNYDLGDTFTRNLAIITQGLNIVGRTIVFEGNVVGRLPRHFMTDANGAVITVMDKRVGNILTITATGINALTLPVDIDPSLTPVTNIADTRLLQSTPTTNYGTSELISNVPLNSFLQNSLISFDFTALPLGATITSSTLELYYYLYAVADPVGRTIAVSRLTRTGWTELGATWNTYDGSNAWTSGGGDYTAVDAATQVVPAAYGWMTWDVLAQAQYAQTNTGEIIHMHIRDTSGSVNKQTYWRSRSYVADPSLRPKLTINYTTVPPLSSVDTGYKSISTRKYGSLTKTRTAKVLTKRTVSNK